MGERGYWAPHPPFGAIDLEPIDPATIGRRARLDDHAAPCAAVDCACAVSGSKALTAMRTRGASGSFPRSRCRLSASPRCRFGPSPEEMAMPAMCWMPFAQERLSISVPCRSSILPAFWPFLTADVPGVPLFRTSLRWKAFHLNAMPHSSLGDRQPRCVCRYLRLCVRLGDPFGGGLGGAGRVPVAWLGPCRRRRTALEDMVLSLFRGAKDFTSIDLTPDTLLEGWQRYRAPIQYPTISNPLGAFPRPSRIRAPGLTITGLKPEGCPRPLKPFGVVVDYLFTGFTATGPRETIFSSRTKWALQTMVRARRPRPHYRETLGPHPDA